MVLRLDSGQCNGWDMGITEQEPYEEIRKAFDGKEFRREVLDGYEQYVLNNAPTLANKAYGNEKIFFPKLFSKCYSKVISDNNVTKLNKLPDIENIQMIKKKKEVKGGLFGLKKEMVEYEEENPDYYQIKEIIEKEKNFCILRIGDWNDNIGNPWSCSSVNVDAVIFTESGDFYQLGYSYEDWWNTFGSKHRDIKRVFISEKLSYSIDIILNLVCTIAHLFSPNTPIEEIIN